MWCTRWFLPLVILPLPTAPPYFLAIFLISLFLHARPCFYCMMLLTALFTSSCYWQAVPIDTPLTRPIWNATTFGEAVRANSTVPTTTNVNVNVNVELPPVVQLIDRCWCNVFSRSGLFEPGDVNAWERESVEKARRAVEVQYVKSEEEKAGRGGVGGGEGEGTIQAGTIVTSDKTSRILEVQVGEETKMGGEKAEKDIDWEHESTRMPPDSRFALRGLRDFLFPTMTTPSSSSSSSSAPKYRLVPGHSSTPPPAAAASATKSASKPRLMTMSSQSETAEAETGTSESRDLEPSSHATNERPTSTEPAKLLRPYYDLRPYGLDITVDFRRNR